MIVPASAKYAIIQEMMARENNLLNISWLCRAAGVSRSGYYSYLQNEEKRMLREAQDRESFEKILSAYNYRGYSKGARGIYMRFLHMDPPEHMNLKKIRRLMKKYGLVCPIRKANPYRRMAKALKTDAVADNLLQRRFEELGPRKALLTDITYIINGKAPRCYMSTIIDACTKELLGWVLSDTLEIDFVLETVEMVLREYSISLSTETFVHSDQGCHYTSLQFRQLLKNAGLRQSMSRRANCWDNAPQESFFGHMKDEIDISHCSSFHEIHEAVSDWTDYYNNDRCQWDLAKLTPREYYRYLSTSEYPLHIPTPKGKNYSEWDFENQNCP